MSIIIKGNTFILTGNIVNLGGKTTENFIIKAFDHDLNADDLLGETSSGKEGTFSIQFHRSHFANFFEKNPNLYFRVYHDDTLLLDTKTTWTKRMKESTNPIILKIDYPDSTITKKTIIHTISATEKSIRSLTPNTESSEENELSVSITNDLNIDVDVYIIDEITAAPSSKLGSVAKNSTASILIPSLHRGKIIQLNSTGIIPGFDGKYYHQFPLLQKGVPTAGPMNAVIIKNRSKAAAAQAFDFYQLSQANPTSPIVKAFVKALGTPPSALNPTAAISAVNAFFANQTTRYSSCDWYTYFMILNWFSTHTSGWQGTYYLYKNQTPAPYEIYAELVITSTVSENSAILTPYADGKKDPSKKENLSFSENGKLVGPTNETPISLGIGWTALGSISNPIIAAIVGTVKGDHVIGNMNKREKVPGNTTTTIAAAAQKSKDDNLDLAAVIISSIVGTVAFAIGVPLMIKMYRNGLKEAINPDGSPLTNKTLTDALQKLSDDLLNKKDPANPVNPAKEEEEEKEERLSFEDASLKDRANEDYFLEHPQFEELSPEERELEGIQLADRGYKHIENARKLEIFENLDTARMNISRIMEANGKAPDGDYFKELNRAYREVDTLNFDGALQHMNNARDILENTPPESLSKQNPSQKVVDQIQSEMAKTVSSLDSFIAQQDKAQDKYKEEQEQHNTSDSEIDHFA